MKMKKIYWSTAIDDAIVKYAASDDINERNILMEDIIYIPLKKLVECVLNTFKLTYANDFREEVDDAVTYCVTKFPSFKIREDFTGFTYFTTITKRYFIQKRIAKKKNELRSVYLDEVNEDGHLVTELDKLKIFEVDNKIDIVKRSAELADIWQSVVKKVHNAPGTSRRENIVIDRINDILSGKVVIPSTRMKKNGLTKNVGKYDFIKAIGKGICSRNTVLATIINILRLYDNHKYKKIDNSKQSYINEQMYGAALGKVIPPKKKYDLSKYGKNKNGTATRICPRCKDVITVRGKHAGYNALANKDKNCFNCAREVRLGMKYMIQSF